MNENEAPINNTTEAPINNITDTPMKEENISKYNKKAIRLIVLLVIGGIALGLLLSSFFITEANNKIQEFAR